MTQCQHCGRKTSLPLCTPCTHQLADLLAELPWLLHQLNITTCRQDRLHHGGGHTSQRPNPINVGAMELMRETAALLHRIALDVSEIHGSERIPALVHATPAEVSRWLSHNVGSIQRHENAGDHYTAIHNLVGDTTPGPIHKVINRADTHFAGPCPHIRGYDRDGDRIPCNTMLYVTEGETHTHCPRCDTLIDVALNRRQAATNNDLLPTQLILETLDSLNEHIPRGVLLGWIKDGKLLSRGYLTRQGIRKHPSRRSDPRVYSLTRARQLAQTRQPACS